MWSALSVVVALAIVGTAVLAQSQDNLVYPDFADPGVIFIGGPAAGGFVLRDPNNNKCTPLESSQLVGITSLNLTCEPVAKPGQQVTVRYNKTYVDHVVRFENWLAYFFFSFDCWDPNRRTSTISVLSPTSEYRTVGIVTQNVTLPGLRPKESGQYGDLTCTDLSPFGRLWLIVQSLDNDDAQVSMSIPFNLNISDRQVVTDSANSLLARVGKDNFAAILIALIAVVFLTTWATILYVSYAKRRARYVNAAVKSNRSKSVLMQQNQRAMMIPEAMRGSMHRRALETMDDVTKPKDFSRQMLDELARYSEGVRIHIREHGYQKLCKGVELDASPKVSSPPSATRVQTLGRTGMSWFQFLPFRLASVGATTLVIGQRGNLIKLPRLFTYTSAHWMALVFFIVVFAFGILFTDLAFTGTIDSNFGYFWLAGGIGLIGTVFDMHSTTKAPTKGMLRLFRSIAAPICEEFMFSYCWVETTRPDDIRTLARAMYEIGLHVWIDTVKLISGSMVSSSLITAVRTANTVVIFLSPEYLARRNTSTELIEALHYPAKIHIHVVKWDSTVYGAVDALVNVFNVPKERITAHKFDSGKKLLIPLNSGIQELNDAIVNGNGWYDLAAMLNAYAKDDNDVLDFQWWIKYASNLGGIPSSAPYPKHIRAWNFFGLLPGFFETTKRKDVQVGNVWIRGDGRRSGKRASAFPWLIIPLIFFMVFPVLDFGLIIWRELDILGQAQSCADLLRDQSNLNSVYLDDIGNPYKETPALQGICRRFYRTEPYTTKYSAFSMDPVMRIFDQLYDQFQPECTANGKNVAYWLNPQLSGKHIINEEPCVYTLQYFFLFTGYFAPRNVHATFFAILLLLYIFLVVLNFNQALNYRAPPACLRPLLATANLARNANRGRKEERESWKKTTSSKKWFKRDIGEDRVVATESEEEILIPEVKVAVHGTGQVADTLRKFLDAIGFLADAAPFDELGGLKTITRLIPSIRTAPMWDQGGAVSPPPRRESLVPSLPFVWVDVFVISTPEYRDELYAIRDTLRYDQMVVVLGNDVGAPPVTDGSTDAGKWLFSVMFIDCNDSKTSFASAVLENISLRTKDALLSYGKQSFKYS
ncbi:hypothetical protein BJ742DRAFT_791143 [Cladochytrium replicatum]|nr:hypothetical protein BJ742DRAFT_791143 [Cladochytrium replicatum]